MHQKPSLSLEYARAKVPTPVNAVVKWLRRSTIVSVLIAGILIAQGVISYRFSPVEVQRRNMKAAAPFVPIMEARLAGSPRFSHVSVAVFTGNDGSLMFYGYVQTDEDLKALEALIHSGPLPPQVVNGVRLASKEMGDDLSDGSNR